MSKLMLRTIPFLFLLLLVNVGQASAQGGSVYFGGGSAWNSAGTSPGCPSGNLFDSFSDACEPGPTMGGAFGVFGADYMFRPHLGFNGEYAFRFAQAPYLPAVGLNMRPSFFDFNAVYEPTISSDSRVVPVLYGGIGVARVSLYVAQNCTVTGINCSSSYPAGINANHFQVHAGAGVKIYVKGNIFIKPQFDFHYVPNLTDQFAHNYVPQATISIGYTFGEH